MDKPQEKVAEVVRMLSGKYPSTKQAFCLMGANYHHGITPTQLANILEIDIKPVYSFAAQLEKRGLIYTRKIGKSIGYYPRIGVELPWNRFEIRALMVLFGECASRNITLKELQVALYLRENPWSAYTKIEKATKISRGYLGEMIHNHEEGEVFTVDKRDAVYKVSITPAFESFLRKTIGEPKPFVRPGESQHREKTT